MSTNGWLRVLEMGVTEEKAASLGALLNMMRRLEITKRYEWIDVRDGLFGWEVVAKTNEDIDR